MLERLLNEMQMSVYQCAKLSGIPYTTLLEIVRGKTDIAKPQSGATNSIPIGRKCIVYRNNVEQHCRIS